MTNKFCLYSEVPLITISRGIGCGGMIIARLVAEGLNLELFDDHKLEKELIEMGIRPKDIEDMDEKAPGLFDRILNKKPEVFWIIWIRSSMKSQKKDLGIAATLPAPFLK